MAFKSDIGKGTFDILNEERSSLWIHLRSSIFNYIDIQLDKGLVSIENRQGYCDRGRYLVKVFSECVRTFYVDEQDAFPRYYFDFDALITELDHWFTARNVKVISIHPRSITV